MRGAAAVCPDRREESGGSAPPGRSRDHADPEDVPGVDHAPRGRSTGPDLRLQGGLLGPLRGVDLLSQLVQSELPLLLGEGVSGPAYVGSAHRRQEQLGGPVRMGGAEERQRVELPVDIDGQSPAPVNQSPDVDSAGEIRRVVLDQPARRSSSATGASTRARI